MRQWSLAFIFNNYVLLWKVKAKPIRDFIFLSALTVLYLENPMTTIEYPSSNPSSPAANKIIHLIKNRGELTDTIDPPYQFSIRWVSRSLAVSPFLSWNTQSCEEGILERVACALKVKFRGTEREREREQAAHFWSRGCCRNRERVSSFFFERCKKNLNS